MNQHTETYNNGVAIAKAITIMLMVFGHASTYAPVNHFLLLMRMPLFFVMSGYCFKTKYLTDMSTYLSRRVTGIWVPYVKWSLVFLLFHNLFFPLHIYDMSLYYGGEQLLPYTLKDIVLRGGAIITVMEGHDTMLGGFWFLKDLFFGSLLFFFALKVLRNRWLVAGMFLIVAFLFSLADYHVRYVGITSHLFLAAFFITVGHIFREGKWTFERSWVYIIASFIFIAINSNFWYAEMTTYNYVQMFPYTVCAVLGALMLFGVGQRISNIPCKWLQNWLLYIGKKTFNVLTWHFLCFKLVSLCIILIYGLPIERLAEFPTIKEYGSQGWWFVYLVVGVGVPILWSKGYDSIRSRVSLLQKIPLLFVLIAPSLVSCDSSDDWGTPDVYEYPYFHNNPLPVGKRDLKILCIGNSFTYDATAYLDEMINNSPVHTDQLSVYRLHKDAASLKYWGKHISSGELLKPIHAAGSMKMPLEEGSLRSILHQDWDIVTLQQVSTMAGDYSSFYPYIHQLIDAVREECTNPGVCIAFIMPWSAASWSGREYRGLSGWQSIAEATRMMTEFDGIDVIVPIGTAVQNARMLPEFSEYGELTYDGRHISFGVGRYIAAGTFFESLIAPVFSTTIWDNPYIHEITPAELRDAKYEQKSLTEDLRLDAQQCVVNAVLHPYELVK